MELNSTIEALILAKSTNVDVRPILPPSRQLAQIIASFSNSGGGHIVLGVKYKIRGGIDVLGISMEFNANPITHKALDLLTPRPDVTFGYFKFQGKQVFAISIPSSALPILLQGKKYLRRGASIIEEGTLTGALPKNQTHEVRQVEASLNAIASNATNAKARLVDHYMALIKLVDNLGVMMYPENINTPTTVTEGKVLTKILYSSMVDNFELYLSDILFEIWLANPKTLMSPATVTLEQVLACSDMEEFILYYAKERLSKMKKGSVKNFIKDNAQIADLKVFTDDIILSVEMILQVRHLYSHSNGIVDDQFLKYYKGPLSPGEEYLISVGEWLQKMDYLIKLTNEIDLSAVKKHNLSII